MTDSVYNLKDSMVFPQNKSGNFKFAFVAFIFIVISTRVFSQGSGDEDKRMYNDAKARDQKAIDAAINGWWTESMRSHESRIQWWREARFGMFIHWGIYALPGGEWKGEAVNGYAEHLMRKEKITKKEYLQVAHDFNPVKFNAEEWVLNAKKTGMKYLIITAKHHDGFAMYNSKVSNFDIIEQTPFKRDPMAELTAACRKYNMKFGFYYSHAFDWEHPDAPGNDWEYHNPGGDLNLYGGRNWYDKHPELVPKIIEYLNEKAIPQIKELITQYHPDILWFDTPHKIPLSENIRVLKIIRETDADIVVNGRLVRTDSISFGDYKNTSDRPVEFYPVEGDWEAIPTTNESYGYNSHDHSHKPAGFFIQLLAKAASRNGNLLMNIGPMGNGAFDPTDIKILKGIEMWMGENSESISGTEKTDLPLQSWGVTTQHADKIYLHIFQWPVDGQLIVGGLMSDIFKAYILTDQQRKNLDVKRSNPLSLNITVPVKAPDPDNSVIVLEIAGNVKADSVPFISTKYGNHLLAYDAELTGEGFGFGDGKPKRYYVDGWSNMEQKVSWRFRLLTSQKFTVQLKYTSEITNKGIYQLRVDDHVQRDTIQTMNKNGEVYTRNLSPVTLPAGYHNLEITPVRIVGKELMQLLEVNLVPIDQ